MISELKYMSIENLKNEIKRVKRETRQNITKEQNTHDKWNKF